MYVAVKGGERAILNSYRMLDDYRRGDREVPELSLAQIREQMPLAVSRVMSEARSTIRSWPRWRSSRPPGRRDRGGVPAARLSHHAVALWLRAAFGHGPHAPAAPHFVHVQDVPGGQILGPTYDYTQRLLDFSLEAGREADALPPGETLDSSMPRVTDLLAHEDLIDPELPPEGDPEPFDLTRQPLDFPADRAARLQNLARADEGFLLSMGYSTQRGYGNTHPFAAEIRYARWK